MSGGDRVIATCDIGVGIIWIKVPEGTKGKVLSRKEGGLFSGNTFVVEWDNGTVVEARESEIHPL